MKKEEGKMKFCKFTALMLASVEVVLSLFYK